MSLVALPLFHRLAGQPVVVLGEGEAAEPKRRLVERAGGRIVDDLAQGASAGARIAFIAIEDPVEAAALATRARGLGLLVNVVDQPALCDFTTPSLIDRNPVIVAVGTGGASAGLAKALRLRLDRLLPPGVGALALALQAARASLRARWPGAGERRRALDAALEAGGALDPFAIHGADAVEHWIAGASAAPEGRHVIELTSPDPDDLTLRQARLLGQADALIVDASVPPAILSRARADARRLQPGDPEPEQGIVIALSVHAA